MSAKTPPPATFHLFIYLPTELRHQIWLLSLPLFASHINVQIVSPSSSLSRSHQPAGWRILTPAQRATPPLLVACRESRNLALAVYVRGMDIKRDWNFQGTTLNVGPGWGKGWRERFLHLLERKAKSWESCHLCSHEQKLQYHASKLYWDPKHDWLQVSFTPPSSRRCGSQAICRSHEHLVETRFDSRLSKVILEDRVYEDFKDQNRDRILVEFEGLEGGTGEEVEDVLCTPLKNGAKWTSLNRRALEFGWEDNPWLDYGMDNPLDRALAAALADRFD